MGETEMEREATQNTAVTQSESPLKGLVDRIPYWVRWAAIPALITALSWQSVGKTDESSR